MGEQHKVQASVVDVLRVRPFVFLWASQFFSQIAFNMLNFVLVLRVYQLTGKNTAVSALVLFFLLPQLILSLFAGVLVDRFDKRLVMMITNAARGVLLMPLIVLGDNVLYLYLSAFAISIATQFFLPAEVPMIPSLVKKRLLLPANALFTGTLYGSIIVGYILAGPALKFLGPQISLILIAVCFFIASICNSLLPVTKGSEYLRSQVQRISAITYKRLMLVIFNDIGEVIFMILRSKRILLALAFLTVSQTVIVILGTLLPGYTATVLSIDIEDSSLLLLAPAAFGMIIGSFFVARVGPNIGRSRMVIPGMILSGVMLVLLPVFSRFNTAKTFINLTSVMPFDLFHIVIAICLLLGFFNALVIIPSNIILQERSSDAIRGRIYGLFNGLSALISIIPVAVAGYFSDIFGVGKVFTVMGGFIILLGLLPLLRKKEDI